MWALTLFSFNWARWLEAGWAVSFLLISLSAGLWLIVGLKRRKRGATKSQRNFASALMSTTGISTTSGGGALYPTADSYLIDIRKAGLVLVLSIAAALWAGHYAVQQRGYCTATGDFFDSDHMTVLAKVGDNWWKVRGKDGQEYNFYVCPSGSFGWQAGTFIEFAHYEMRDGCADFSSPLAKVKAY